MQGYFSRKKLKPIEEAIEFDEPKKEDHQSEIDLFKAKDDKSDGENDATQQMDPLNEEKTKEADDSKLDLKEENKAEEAKDIAGGDPTKDKDNINKDKDTGKTPDKKEKEKEEKKKKKKFKPDEKKQSELLRRWKIKIYNIKVQNLRDSESDIFIEYVIGGDFKEKEVINKSGQKETRIGGTRGPHFKTELLKGLKKDEYRTVKTRYENEYNASYLMIQDESLQIEVWEYSKFMLNTFIGSATIHLDEVASGQINHSYTIKNVSGDKKAYVKITFNMAFQEIWDFLLEFKDWKCSDLKTRNNQNSELNPQIELILHVNDAYQPSVMSEIKKNTRVPFWETIPGAMTYRGTVDELESEKLRIILKDDQIIGSDLICDKFVALRGIVDYGMVKSFVLLENKKNPKKPKANDKKDENNEADLEKGSVNGDPETGRTTGLNKLLNNNDDAISRKTRMSRSSNRSKNNEQLVDKNDEIFQDSNQMIQIEGRISLGPLPRFRQRGEVPMLRSYNYYIGVGILTADKLEPPETRAVVNTFVTLEWAGQVKRSGVIYENYKPAFNEEFFFEIPIRASRSEEKKKKLKLVREELRANNIVSIDLWLDGGDGTNDNLGNCKILFSELANGAKDTKIYLDEDKKKEVRCETRVLEVKKKLITGLNDSSGDLLVQLWFLPDLTDDIDVREFSKEKKDKFPPEIELNIEDGYYIDLWENHINNNFKDNAIDAHRAKTFKYYNVKDQYNNLHLVSLYVDKYSIYDYDVDVARLEEDEKIDNAYLVDRRLKTMGELAHFVRCIPFKTETKIPDLWISPDFLSIMKKGDVQDHALFLACLFMGCKAETKDDIDKDEPKKNFLSLKDLAKKLGNTKNEDAADTLENRTFVCVGSHKATKQPHFWVMTIDKNYEIVTFWETTMNKKYELLGRIDKEEQTPLKEFLTGKSVKKKEGGAFGNFVGKGLGLFKDFGMGIEKLAAGDLEDDKKDKNKKNKKSKKKKDDEDEDQSRAPGMERPKMNPEDEEIEGFEEKPIGINELSIKLQSEIGQRSTFLDNLSRLSKGVDKESDRKTFISFQKEKEAQEELNDDRRHLKPVREFFVGGKRVPKVKLPYGSLELIFNNKNIFGNMQNSNPAKIKFHLHNMVHWRPFLVVEGQNGKQEAWKNKLGVFYNFKNLLQPITELERAKLKEQIDKAVNFGVTAARSGSNLETQWKLPRSREVKHLCKYLRLAEYRDTERYTEAEFQQQKAIWENDLKRLMPRNYRYSALPMIFSYSEPERIKSIIVKQASTFILRPEKNAIFALGIKIFPFPNSFNSIRIILAMFCMIPEDEFNDDAMNVSGDSLGDLLPDDDDLNIGGGGTVVNGAN